MGKLVIGYEADITWGGVNGTSTTSFSPVGVPPGVLTLTRSITANAKWTATTVSTVGIARPLADLWKGRCRLHPHRLHRQLDRVFLGAGFPAFSGTGSENRVGWTVGTGIEWAI
jgi:hypothetical protein